MDEKVRLKQLVKMWLRNDAPVTDITEWRIAVHIKTAENFCLDNQVTELKKSDL